MCSSHMCTNILAYQVGQIKPFGNFLKCPPGKALWIMMSSSELGKVLKNLNSIPLALKINSFLLEFPYLYTFII